MRGYILPRMLAAFVPSMLPCNGFARVKAGTQLSFKLPRYVCVEAGHVFEGATVATVTEGEHVCNRPCRQLRAEDVLLDWRPFRDEADLIKLCPILLTTRERLPFSLIPGEEHLTDQMNQFIGRSLAAAARDYSALEGSRRPEAPPLIPVGFLELKVGADGTLGSTRSAVTTYYGRSKTLNPSLHQDGAGRALPAKRVQTADRRNLAFMPDVNEVSGDGCLMAETQLARDTRPASVTTEQLNKKPRLPPLFEAPDAALQVPDVAAALVRVVAKLSAARNAQAHALHERGRDAAERAEVNRLREQARQLREPASRAAALAEVQRDEAARAAAPANMVLAPPAAAASPAPSPAAAASPAPSPAAAPSPANAEYRLFQWSDVGTDTLHYSNVSQLVKDVYAGNVSSHEEAAALLEALTELRQIHFLGGGLHFIMHVVQMILSGHWDHAGLRQWKVVMGRTDFDPTKEAQQLRRKVEMIRVWVAGWFKAAIREFHDTWPNDSVFDFSHDTSATDSEQSRLKSEAHTKAFLEWVEQGKSTGDTEFRKHAVFVLEEAVPLLLYWEASRNCEYETMDVVEKYFLPLFEAFGKDKYTQAVGWMKLKAATRDALSNMIIATHTTNSIGGIFGKSMHGDHFQEIDVNELNNVVTLTPSPEKWAADMIWRSLSISFARVLTKQVATGGWSQLGLGGGEGEHITSSRELEVDITGRTMTRGGIVRADPHRCDLYLDWLGFCFGAHVVDVKGKPISVALLLDQPLVSYVGPSWPPVLLCGGERLKGAAGGSLAVTAKLRPGAFVLGCSVDPDYSRKRGGGGDWHETKRVDGVGRGFLGFAPPAPRPEPVDVAALRIALRLPADGSSSAPQTAAATTVLNALRLDVWKGVCGKTEVRLLQVSWADAELPAQGPATALLAAVKAVLPAGALLTKIDGRAVSELWKQRNSGQSEQQFVVLQTHTARACSLADTIA